MWESGHHNWVALVSVNEHAIIGGIIHSNVLKVDNSVLWRMLEKAQEVMRGVAEYVAYMVYLLSYGFSWADA